MTKQFTGIYEKDHVVQYYSRDSELIQNLKSFIGGGLAVGDPCLVIATAAHRLALDKQLTNCHLDVVGLRSAGMFVTLDAADVLGQIQSNGGVSEDLFGSVVGPVLQILKTKGRTVRIYGEVVALLAGRAEYRSAIELEKIWNNASKHYPITLYCAYPTKHFAAIKNEAAVAMLEKISGLHGRVINLGVFDQPGRELKAIPS